MIRPRHALALLLLLPVLTACGGSGSDTGTNSSEAPRCDSVWIDGKTLPEGYEGCIRSDGDLEAAVSTPCDEGRDIVTYEPDGDGFFTETDGKIVQAGEDYANDPAYTAANEACAGAPAADEDATTATCAEVWIVGETLPEDYTGCDAAAGERDLGVKDCDSTGQYAGFMGEGGEVFALLGGEIVSEDADDTTAYDAFYQDCFTG